MTEVKRRYRGVSADDRQQRRRRLLIDACLDLIGEGGIAAVTAESVSATAKLTKRYFYESFAGRDAILVAALDELFEELIAKIEVAISAAHPGIRAEAITDVFVMTMCNDPRRARLYAESSALPALRERRENAIVTFTDLIVEADHAAASTDYGKRRLMTRIVVAGVTDVVTGWINGVLVADRSTLTEAIVALGRTGNAG
ncbi:TetR/AcrR family transcriptional regulator [Mycolicibacterium hodleri]|uniref:TetR/AcrR family transcriptional regulator n=1 Tax=Mycolicibacterium hodleri TaxID=49897 RepID=UPI0013762041|nr:TetR family transcriptional regulator [Mycolicibacterium hodleri]